MRYILISLKRALKKMRRAKAGGRMLTEVRKLINESQKKQQCNDPPMGS